MNKLYVTALACTLAGAGASAQQAVPFLTPGNDAAKTHNGTVTAPVMRHNPAGADRGASFYSEDFSGGSIPSGWTNVDELTPVGTPEVTFVWSDDPTAVEPAALGYTASAVFNAPGASNGYLWANSDRGLPSAPGTDHLTHLTTDAIDCSGQGSVLLTFQSLIGVFDYNASTNVKVRVSTDLSNWTDFVPFPCLETGAAAPPCTRWSANPESVALDISSVAANQSTVYIQFEWLGGWEYFWAIDDVQLRAVPPFEMIMNYGYVSSTGDGEEYGRIPASQLPANMNVGAEVVNFGSMDQTNVVVNVSVENEGGSEVFSATTNVGTMVNGDVVVTDENPALPALPPNVYTATYTVNSDQIGSDSDPSNNTRVRTFEVTNELYALDGVGIHPPGLENLTSLGTNSFTDNEDGLVLMTFYPVNQDLTVHGLEILLDGGSEVGGFVVISVYDTASIYADDITSPIAESQTVDVTQADLDAGKMRVFFDSPVDLSPEGYYVGVTLFSNAGTGHIRVVDDATVPQPFWGSMIYVPSGTQVGTFSNGNALAIRMLLGTNVGSEDNSLQGVTLYPNPTNGLLNINTPVFDGYTIEVLDMLGKRVMEARANGNTTIDLRGQAKGVYSVRISSAQGSTVERVTLD